MTETNKSIAAADARANFSEILAKAYYQGKLFVVKKSRKPMAVIIGIEQFKALQKAARGGASPKTQAGTPSAEKEEKVGSQQTVNKILSVSY